MRLFIVLIFIALIVGSFGVGYWLFFRQQTGEITDRLPKQSSMVPVITIQPRPGNIFRNEEYKDYSFRFAIDSLNNKGLSLSGLKGVRANVLNRVSYIIDGKYYYINIPYHLTYQDGLQCILNTQEELSVGEIERKIADEPLAFQAGESGSEFSVSFTDNIDDYAATFIKVSGKPLSKCNKRYFDLIGEWNRAYGPEISLFVGNLPNKLEYLLPTGFSGKYN